MTSLFGFALLLVFTYLAGLFSLIYAGLLFLFWNYLVVDVFELTFTMNYLQCLVISLGYNTARGLNATISAWVYKRTVERLTKEGKLNEHTS